MIAAAAVSPSCALSLSRPALSRTVAPATTAPHVPWVHPRPESLPWWRSRKRGRGKRRYETEARSGPIRDRDRGFESLENLVRTFAARRAVVGRDCVPALCAVSPPTPVSRLPGS
jgi:hypothetical protein